MKCWIFDDQYGKKLYEEMKASYSFLEYPVKDNVNTPLDYIDKIENGDLILLDNYFPGKQWEEELGEKFLGKYLELGLRCKIICISDYGKKLVDKFYNWGTVNNNGDIIYWCPSKDIKDIPKKYFNLLQK